MAKNFKKIVTISLIFLLCINYIAFISILANNNRKITTDERKYNLRSNNGSGNYDFRVGTSAGPSDLDPVNSWESASNDVIEQVAEGLFSYDYSDINLPRINKLATDYWWENTTTLHIKLREGVLFHDGTPFNASAAKWNFDRINYLINATGNLPPTFPAAQTKSLWQLPSGEPIINRTEVVGDYNITIHLNDGFSPFLDLLCYSNAYMLSPSSTPAYDYINTTTGDLVGTGPFVYDSYTENVEVRFSRWDSYWRSPAFFEEVIYVISNSTYQNNAMLNGELDYIHGAFYSWYPTFEADPEITLYKFTEETGKTSLIYQYLGFNNRIINTTMRNAMAYAFNYSYMIEELLDEKAIRSYSPISPGWGSKYYNESINWPKYNLTEARRILVESGVAPNYLPITGEIDNSDWLNAEIASYTYTGNSDNQFRADLLFALQDWYDQIGITVINNLVTWSEYLDILINPSRHDELELYFIGWAPDYFNPWNMLDPLFNPASSSNSAQVNETYLTQMLADISEELNEPKRNKIIRNLQKYFADKQFHLYAYHPTVNYVHAADLRGVPYNAMGVFYIYPIYRPKPGPFSLSSTAEEPDSDGYFYLSWNASSDANNYSVYQYSSYITEINQSLVPLKSEINELSTNISAYDNGSYYFIVVAHNEIGDKNSNCLEVNISLVPEKFIIRVGTSSGPIDLDPVNSWDSASNDVIEQVAEGLFSYDYSDINLPRINKLATDYWWENTKTLHIKLREGVLFHDGTPFNASAAKWNFDRINYLINATGNLPSNVPTAKTRSLWQLPSGEPIINRTEVVGNYNITIHLNGGFSPFLDLLCYTNAYMLSPASTPAQNYIDISDDLVGTGPFKYDSYSPYFEVHFTGWDNYWTIPAYSEKLVFDINPNAGTRSNAMLNGEIDYILRAPTYSYDTFEADPDITFYEFTEDSGKTSLVYQYLGVNNNKINVTYRRAMAYAFNYTHMINEFLDGRAIKAYSPISSGWGSKYYNSSVDYPNYDLAKARQILIEAGVAPVGATATNDTSGSNADPWIEAANSQNGRTPVGVWKYTGNIDNQFRNDMYYLLYDNYEQIGIDLINDLISWGEYLDILFNPSRHDELELYFIGWAPDYFNPWNMLDPLFNPTSSSNFAQVDDPVLTQKLADVIEELNSTKRNEMIKWIQWYMAENQFHIYGYHPKITYVHAADLKGVYYNSMGVFYAYPIYRSTPRTFSLSSTAEDPDTDGNFDLIWIGSSGAKNYSVYQYSSYITEINSNLTLLKSETTELNINLSGYDEDKYYFIIVAHNEFGDTLSNCIEIRVKFLPGNFILSSTAEDPDSDGNFDLNWTVSSKANNYSLYQYWGFITEVNSSLTLLAGNTDVLSMVLSDYARGKYYFIVVAHNEVGDTLSNCIEITVESLPGEFILSSTAEDPDTDGNFDLNWTASSGANNYSVYLHSSYITEINTSLTLLNDNIDVLSMDLSGYDDGTYYFIVVAHNEIGDTQSNCLKITVEKEEAIPEIPGYDFLLIIAIFGVAVVYLIKKRKIN